MDLYACAAAFEVDDRRKKNHRHLNICLNKFGYILGMLAANYLRGHFRQGLNKIFIFLDSV